MTEVKKKKFQVPHVYVLLVGIIIFCCILTYIIPAGSYDMVTDPVSGREVVDASSYHLIEQHPVSLLKVPQYVYNGILKQANTVFMVILGMASTVVLMSTGAIDVAMRKMILKFKGKESLLLVAMMLILAFIGIRRNAMGMVAYVPMLVMMCRMCGYDAMCAVSLIILGAGGTFSCGMINMAITGVAQDFCGLPRFSGLGYRTLSAVIILIISTIYLLRYAKMVKADPTKSIVYDLECEEKQNMGDVALDDSAPMTWRQWGVIASFLASIIGSTVGYLYFSWSDPQGIGWMLTWAVIGGLAAGYDLNWIAKAFVKGAGSATMTGFMIGIAGAISLVLSDGMIVDSIIYGISSLFGLFPRILQPALLYIINSLVNVFITSGSGQAAVVMPILAPLSDIVGITRQTCVLAFNFGDGFSNFLLPTSAALMGNINAANIPITKWYKFFIKLFLLWSLAAVILVTVAAQIQLGPF